MRVRRLSRSMPAPEPGVVHLGLGAFFRSHGALMIEDAVTQSGGDWGVSGVSLKSPRVRDQLRPQANAYTAIEMGADAQKKRVVNILSDVIYAPEDPEHLVARLADPRTKIVSLTVTEKGYCHVPSTGMLDPNHPDIARDLSGPHPVSAVGYIVRGLQRRHAAGLRPFTVLSCDNLPDNGRVARNVVTGLARLIDTGLAEWIAHEGRFPATMVDRIVPATTPADVDRLAAASGVRDEAPVFHEPFCQWVIEDRFVDNERPAFESVEGVQLVGDVAPFELMKIRMLNGTHSALAYLGYLAGIETVSQTVQDPVFRTFVRCLWRDEIIPTLTPPAGVSLQTYAGALLERYDNPAVQHRTWQIAMDGSQKLPQRILGTIMDNQRAARNCDGLLLAVAAWMRYVGGRDEQGKEIDVKDPLASRLRMICENTKTHAETVDGLLSVQEVFGQIEASALRDGIVSAYGTLATQGSRASVEAFLSGQS